MSLRRSLLAAFALAAAGCASGPAFQPLSHVAADQGVVYFYRPGQYGGAIAVRIEVDGAPAGELRAAGYLPLTLSPGPHVINSPESFGLLAPRSASLEVNVASGGSQFVRVAVNESGAFSSNVTFQSVSERVALSEITSLRLSQ